MFFLQPLICRWALLHIIWSCDWDNLLQMFGCLTLRGNQSDSLSPSSRLLGLAIGFVLSDLHQLICCPADTANTSRLHICVRTTTLLLKNWNHIVYYGRRLGSSWVIFIFLLGLLLFIYVVLKICRFVSCLCSFQHGIWTLYRQYTFFIHNRWGGLLSFGASFLAWVLNTVMIAVVYKGSRARGQLLLFVLWSRN